ncbi:MAG: hypothetical protein LC660_15330 [Desulfobacteraceae bacterium]|nr:hypothetical protein [Desulfobacteraceae bacterium]
MDIRKAGAGVEGIVEVSGPGFLCYSPPFSDKELPVNRQPALTNGYVTFGSFNNLAKISPEILDIWAKLLIALPDSKLFLKGSIKTETGLWDKVKKALTSRGIRPDRITILEHVPSQKEHLAYYNKIDVALAGIPTMSGRNNWSRSTVRNLVVRTMKNQE